MRYFLCIIFLCACAEKRQLPESQKTIPPASIRSTIAAPAAAKTLPGDRPVPKSFLSSNAAKAFFHSQTGKPITDNTVRTIIVLDLNEDGNDEIILIPGEFFCGTGGCAPGNIYQELKGDWKSIGSIVTNDSPRQWNEFSQIVPSEQKHHGFFDLEIQRESPNSSIWARFNGKSYELEFPELAKDLLSEDKASSFLLHRAKYEKELGEVTLGVWDKFGANAGAKITVRVLSPSKEEFSKNLGIVAKEDNWHETSFPSNFSGAPKKLAPGTYQVEYLINGKKLPGTTFQVF